MIGCQELRRGWSGKKVGVAIKWILAVINMFCILIALSIPSW